MRKAEGRLKKLKKERQRQNSPNKGQNGSSWVVIEHTIEPEPFSADWFALNFLREWTPQDLAVAIRKGYQVDLSAFAGMVVDMAVNKILDWFKTYRPDLYAVLNTEEGIEWLKKNIKTILS